MTWLLTTGQSDTSLSAPSRWWSSQAYASRIGVSRPGKGSPLDTPLMPVPSGAPWSPIQRFRCFGTVSFSKVSIASPTGKRPSCQVFE